MLGESIRTYSPFLKAISPEFQLCLPMVDTVFMGRTLAAFALTRTLLVPTEAPKLNSGSTRWVRSSPRKMIGPCCPLWPFQTVPTP